MVCGNFGFNVYLVTYTRAIFLLLFDINCCWSYWYNVPAVRTILSMLMVILHASTDMRCIDGSSVCVVCFGSKTKLVLVFFSIKRADYSVHSTKCSFRKHKRDTRLKCSFPVSSVSTILYAAFISAA